MRLNHYVSLANQLTVHVLQVLVASGRKGVWLKLAEDEGEGQEAWVLTFHEPLQLHLMRPLLRADRSHDQ